MQGGWGGNCEGLPDQQGVGKAELLSSCCKPRAWWLLSLCQGPPHPPPNRDHGTCPHLPLCPSMETLKPTNLPPIERKSFGIMWGGAEGRASLEVT